MKRVTAAGEGVGALGGVLAILLGTLGMSLSDALAKAGSADLTIWQIYLARALLAVPALVLVALLAGAPLRPRSPGWTALRSLLLTVMWIAFYSGLPMLTLSVAAVGLYTAPLMIVLLSALVSREPVGLRRVLAAVIGFLGVLAILRPGGESAHWAAALPVLAALCYALAMVVTREKCAGEAPWTLSLGLNISLGAAGLIGVAVLAMIDLPQADAAAYPFLLTAWAPMSVGDWALIAALAALIIGYSMAVAVAYLAGPAALIACFDYSYLLWAALWGFVFFAETPDAATVAGMAMIAGAGLLTLAPPRRRSVRARTGST